MSNLISLHHFVVSDDGPHSKICEVGKLQMLQELRRFEVKSEKNGFELRQLGQLSELSGLSICNLEKVQVKEEANDVNLSSKNCLKKLTLEWDIQRSNKDPDKEAQVLNVLRPHDNLQELCIRGHGGPSCPDWLGSKISVKKLQSLRLDAVDWNVLPPLGEFWLLNERGIEYLRCIRDQSFQNLKRLELVCLPRLKKWAPNDTCHLFSLLEAFIVRDCLELTELPFSQCTSQKLKQDGNINLFPRIQELQIDSCPKLDSLPLIPWTNTLHYVDMKDAGSGLEKLVYSRTSSSSELLLEIKENYHLCYLDEMVAFGNLSELQVLEVSKCPPLTEEHLHSLTFLKTLKIRDSSHVLLPLGGLGDAKYKLPVERLEILNCSASAKELAHLLWHLPELSFLNMSSCHKVTSLGVAAIEPTSTPSCSSHTMETQLQQQQILQIEDDGDEGGRLLLLPPHLSISLRTFLICDCPELRLVASLPPRNDSTAGGVCVVGGQDRGGEGLQSLHSLQGFVIEGCPKFLSTFSSSSTSRFPFPSSLTRGHLSQLAVYATPKFFASWESWIEELQLQMLWTNGIAGVLVAPICILLSSSLNKLVLRENKELVHFTEEQEKALGHITSLQHLCFFELEKLQSLPAALHGLHNLKRMEIGFCPAIRSLPKDFLPSSLKRIDIHRGCSEELEHQCIMLEGITVRIRPPH